MFLINTNYFNDITFKTDFNKFKDEFEDFRINENIRRCEVLALVLIIINIVLIGVDLLVYKPMRSEVAAYLYLYYSHIAMLIFLCIWLSLLSINRKYNQVLHRKIFSSTFFFISVIWCTFMGINSVKITAGITAYIICMVSFSACFFMPPRKAFFIYSISAIVFITGLIFIIQEPKVLYSNIINGVIAIMLIQVTSVLNYSSFLKEFLNNKHILQNKEELEAANRKLKEYENMRTDFFANISHELRTPLNVICSAEQMITSTLKDSDFNNVKINKYLKMIKQNTYRLLRLINNLIDITKIDASSFKVKLVNSDVIKIVEDITLSVADFIEHQEITLTFDTEIEEKTIACDPDNIERIILNLLSNAVKYGEKNGSIFVNIFLDAEHVCISVKDTGMGIPEDMQAIIFERFIQIDKSSQRIREGSGIGLALVKSLVEMQGGDISVKSKLGEGSEFIIRMPNRQLPESSNVISASHLEEDYTLRGRIEFSDIYK